MRLTYNFHREREFHSQQQASPFNQARNLISAYFERIDVYVHTYDQQNITALYNILYSKLTESIQIFRYRIEIHIIY